MEQDDLGGRAKRRWPWFVTITWGLLMAGLAAGVSLFGDPEAVFWRDVVQQRDTSVGVQRARSKEPMVFVGGGSSCSFSIHADSITEETGMPAVNMGGSAAMGYRYLIEMALGRAVTGDVVVLQLEPGILKWSERGPSTLARKMDPFSGERASGRIFYDGESDDALSVYRPGAKFLGTLMGKLLKGGPMYRYQFEDIQPNGVMTMEVSSPNPDVEGYAPMKHLLDARVIEDLKSVAKYAGENGVKVYYTLPWECFSSKAVGPMRMEHAGFLAKLEKALPVVRDEMMGAVDDNSWFLDTGFHMTLDAGRMRSRILGRALKLELEKAE